MRQAGELVCFLRGISIGTEAGIGEGIHYGSYYDYRLIIGIAHNIIQFLILSVVKKTQQQQQKHIYIYIKHLPKSRTAAKTGTCLLF